MASLIYYSVVQHFLGGLQRFQVTLLLLLSFSALIHKSQSWTTDGEEKIVTIEVLDDQIQKSVHL